MRLTSLLSLFVLSLSAFAFAQESPRAIALRQQIQASTGQLNLTVPLGRPSREVLLDRRKLVEELIRTSPASVREIALPSAAVQSLISQDSTLAPVLETAGERIGRLNIVIGDNFAAHTSKQFYSLSTADGMVDLRFTGDEPAASLLHRQVAVSGIGTSTYLAAETIRPVSEVEANQAPQALPPASPPGAPSTSLSTKGVQNYIVFIVNMPGLSFPAGLDSVSFWQTQFFSSTFPSLNTLWSTMSDGQTSATGTVYSPLTLSQAYACDQISDIASATVAAATTAGINLSAATHIAIIFPAASCDYGGRGSLGSAGVIPGQLTTVMWLAIVPGQTTSSRGSLLAHEGGHNLGLNHANSYDYGNTPVGALDTADSGVINTEYGDPYTIMGYPYPIGGYYSVLHRSLFLNWLNLGTDYMEVTTPGTYTIVPAENSTGLRALRISRAAVPGAWLWAEYRQPIGPIDSGFSSTASNIFQGALLHYEDPYGNSGYDFVVDMTATAKPNNFQNSTLVSGSTWNDPYSLLNIKTISATSSGLTLSISYDTPCATLTPSYVTSTALPATASSGLITVTAPSTCSWQASTAASWITFTSAISGTGNGTLSFNIAANTGSERESFITVQRQSVPLIQQQGTGVSVVGITPAPPGSGLTPTFTVDLSAPDAATMKALTGINLDIAPYPGYGLGTTTHCHLLVAPYYGGSSVVWLWDDQFGQYDGYVTAGSASSISNDACSISGSGISVGYNATATGLTFTVPVIFSPAHPGSLNIAVTPNGYATTVFGSWTLSSTPAISLVPLTVRRGYNGPFTATGVLTHFSSATTVSSPAGITLSSISSTNSTLLSGTLAVASTAPIGPQSLTFVSGTEQVSSSINIVDAADTTTTVVISPSSGGSSTLFTVTATVSAARGSPTGSVTFYDGTIALYTTNLSSGLSGAINWYFSNGTHSITAAYSGDPTFNSSTSAATSLTISGTATTTTLALAAVSGDPNNSYTLTASVQAATGTPTGAVTFYDGTSALNTVNLNGGTNAVLTWSFSRGSHSLTARYSGDTTFSSSTSTSNTLTIGGAATTTTLAASASSGDPSTSFTITATVHAVSGTPSGTITFYDGTTSLGSVSLNGSSSAALTRTFSIGAHSITALYSGDTTFGSSTSAATTLTIAGITTTTTLATSAATLAPNQTTILTAKVSGGSTAPSGVVTFLDGTTALASVILSSGSASYTTAALPVGSHSYKASYAGDSATYSASTSSATVVNIIDFGIGSSSSTINLTAGVNGNATLTLTPGSSGFPVVISISCTGAPSSSTCSLTPSTIAPGASAATVSLSIATIARSAIERNPAIPWKSTGGIFLAALLLLVPSRCRALRSYARLLCVATIFISLNACGGGKAGGGGSSSSSAPTGTQAGSYQLNITATAAVNSQSISHTVQIALTVN